MDYEKRLEYFTKKIDQYGEESLTQDEIEEINKICLEEYERNKVTETVEILSEILVLAGCYSRH